MKILFTLRFFPSYGGGETVTMSLAETFAKHGEEVHIFYLWDRGDEPIDEKVILHKVKNINGPQNIENIHSSDIETIYKDLKDYIDNNHFDYVINQWLDPKKVYEAVSCKSKVIHCRHTSIYINSKKQELIKKIFGQKALTKVLSYKYRPYIKYGDKFVMLCEEYSNEIKTMFNHKFDNKIDYCLNPCRFTTLNEVKLSNKENSICYVGRLNKNKNVESLVRCWELISKKFPDWRFYIVGTGEAQNELIGLSNHLKLKNIFFEGFQNPLDYYKKSKIMLSASSNEGYPMTIIEAMMFGCVPIVSNTYSALNGLISSNFNGIKVNNTNYMEFVNVLINILSNQVKISEMANNCIDFAKQYDAENVIQRWYKLFNELKTNN